MIVVKASNEIIMFKHPAFGPLYITLLCLFPDLNGYVSGAASYTDQILIHIPDSWSHICSMVPLEVTHIDTYISETNFYPRESWREKRLSIPHPSPVGSGAPSQ